MSDENIKNPEISIIIPCYNTANYIGMTLSSILNQSFKNFEVICIDDGSADNTLDVLAGYEKQFDSIHVYTDENHGQGYQRNVGLRYAKGRYVYFMDSDDLLDPDCLEQLYDYAEKNMLDVLYFEADAFYESKELEEQFPQYKTLYHRNKKYPGIYIGKNLFVKFMNGGEFIVSPCLQFTRREYLLENQIQFPELSCLEDNLYTVQVLLYAERTGCISNVLYYRRLRKNSVMTGNLEKNRFTSYYAILLGFFEILSSCDEQPDLQQALCRQIGSICNNLLKDYSRLTEEQKTEYVSSEKSEKLYFAIKMCQSFNNEKAYIKEGKKLRKKKLKSLEKRKSS